MPYVYTVKIFTTDLAISSSDVTMGWYRAQTVAARACHASDFTSSGALADAARRAGDRRQLVDKPVNNRRLQAPSKPVRGRAAGRVEEHRVDLCQHQCGGGG